MIHFDHNDKKWEVVASEYLFRRPWLTVRRDQVKLPDGRINPEFYVLEYPSWVNIIAITAQGQMVLVRQYRHGFGDTRLELCAGVVEEGETPLQGAMRELQEETGYAGGEWHQIMVSSGNASTTNNRTYSFVATGVERVSSQHLDSTEDLEVVLLSPDQVFELLQGGEFVQSLMLAPLWKYFFMQKCNG